MPRLGVPSPTDTDTRLPPDVRDGSVPLSRSITPQKRSTGTQFRLLSHSTIDPEKGTKGRRIHGGRADRGGRKPRPCLAGRTAPYGTLSWPMRNGANRSHLA